MNQIKNGSAAIIFSPGDALLDLFPEELAQVQAFTGEFADLAPSVGEPLAAGLEVTDLKWWARPGDERVFVLNRAYRVLPGAGRRVLVRFIPAHGYPLEGKLWDIVLTALVEITIGRGRLWICGLDLERSVEIDPAARRFAVNLIRAASPEFSPVKVKQPESEQ
ncbi:MAG: hypothetical protein ACE15E_18070 [Acidobacteriota bacterium]